MHWSLISPKAGTLGQSIDEFIQKKLSQKGLRHSSEASKRTLIRRVYLDMLGLLPSPEEVEAFLSDESKYAYEQLLEKVLENPSYGERWARHWLDVVRYADSAGFETNHERPNSYHYRDYVIRAFNEDKPYDRFVFEQVAGDTVDQHAATGFLVAGPKDIVGGKDPLLRKQQRANELADIVGVTGSAFLGLTVGCARCHDHKFDPISQKDFYSMQAVFEGVVHGERNVPLRNEDKKEIDELGAEKSLLQKELRRFIPESTVSYVLLDDENSDQVEFLQKSAGKGTNPKGTDRGYLNDPGDAKRSPNLSSEPILGGRTSKASTSPSTARKSKEAFAFGSPGAADGARTARTRFTNWMPTATPPRRRIVRPLPPSTSNCSPKERARWSASRCGVAFRIPGFTSWNRNQASFFGQEAQAARSPQTSFS